MWKLKKKDVIHIYDSVFTTDFNIKIQKHKKDKSDICVWKYQNED
jgi:hypothetical protein